MSKLKNVTLREQKAAQTKIAIIKSVQSKLNEKSLAEISVKEICDDVLISEGTFFNYFPKKSDILTAFIQFWSVEILWIAKVKYQIQSGLGIIEKVLEETGKQLVEGPNIMREIISMMAIAPSEMKFDKLTPVEKKIAFPDCGGIESIDDDQLNTVFYDNIMLAIEQGELPPDTNPVSAMVNILSIFFGIPLMLKDEFQPMIPDAYKEQFQYFLKAFRKD